MIKRLYHAKLTEFGYLEVVKKGHFSDDHASEWDLDRIFKISLGTKPDTSCFLLNRINILKWPPWP